jgi:Tc toxin complex TcA C-terminal TcB-binding domain
MRYIDNLLDWADELFTQFQMETVNEAMILYATAADILGPRPAMLGACGEVVSPKTYETVAPFLGRGSEFLTELEHWVFVRNAPRYFDKLRAGKERYVLDVAKAKSASEAALTLERVRFAGLVSKATSLRTAKSVALVTDAADDSAMVKARLAIKDQPYGSADAGDPGLELIKSRADDIEDSPARIGMGVGPVTIVEPGRDKAALFGLDKIIDWKDLSSSGPESRRLPARDYRVKDVLRRNPRTFPHFGWSFIRQVNPAFCVPANKDLLGYWDRLEDRLWKIRNCRDITGAKRSLSLFAPEIDPMALVRAKAAGLSLEDVLDALAGELPPYRFSYLLERAKSFAATVQGLGNELQAALERRDTEELNELRVEHQRQLLILTTKVREWEYDAAAAAVESLQKRRDGAQHRRAYYQTLVDTGLSPEEWTQRISRHIATGLRTAEATLDMIAGVTHLIPQLGSPFAMKYGGSELGNSFAKFAGGMSALATIADLVSASAALEAGFSRRDQGWREQIQSVDDELADLEKQMAGAELRRDIAERSMELHQKTIEQNDEIYDLYRDHFTSTGLYIWLSTELQRLHREAYNTAYAAVRMVERTYRFERDDQGASLLAGNYWDASHAGLKAGERLLADLGRLESRYLETNYRKLEIDQSFSILQLDPAALVRLRETGACEFDLPELAFDMVYPGHYRRRIRSVRLTIPSITGPYTNVSATLRMLENKLRREPQLGDANVLTVPMPPTTVIATSTAQNDGGVFEMSFHDERYMPFEGAGAISRWRLELPANFRSFDYQTINDVIISVAYSADEDGALRTAVEQVNAALEGTIMNVLSNVPMGRLFSLRQDFSTAFTRLLHSPAGTQVPIEITDRHFPVFLAGREIAVSGARIAIRTAEGAAPTGLRLKLNGANQSGFVADADLGGLPAKNVAAALGANVVGSHTIEIDQAGDLAPDAPAAGDLSALDDTKLADVLLFVETQLA